MPHHKLSLRSAIFININVMLGSGIFINTTILAKRVGLMGAFCYSIIGLLMFPLVLCLSRLLSIYPQGGFYIFGKKAIHPFVGFLSAWSYAIGKLASAVIITQLSVLLMQQMIPFLATFNSLFLNGMIMTLFIMLNMLDIKSGAHIQTIFLGLKTIPILFGIFAGLYLFLGNPMPVSEVTFNGIPFALPLILFSIVGFEVACSLSSHIKDSAVNGPRAIFTSYAIVICATTLFQMMIYLSLQSELVSMIDYRSVFPALTNTLLPYNAIMKTHLINLFNCAIAASALGGSYGIIFSNSWNIYAIVKHRHFFGADWLMQLNRYGIPWLCVLIEGMIYFLFLIISRGNQIPLQQLGALGPTIAYTISAFCLWVVSKKNREFAHNKKIALLAIGNCILLFCSTVYGLVTYGPHSLMLFIILLVIGMIMFFGTYKSSINLNNS